MNKFSSVIRKIGSYFSRLVRKKTIGAYIGLAVLPLTIAMLIVYLMYTATNSALLMQPLIVVLLIAALVLEVALFFFDNDYMPIVIAVLPLFSLGLFLKSPLATLWSVASYINGGSIIMEGANPENFGLIIIFTVLSIVTAAVAVAACFFKRIKLRKSRQDNVAQTV